MGRRSSPYDSVVSTAYLEVATRTRGRVEITEASFPGTRRISDRYRDPEDEGT
jgi:hypothetical protein